jgi:hypothetical protein
LDRLKGQIGPNVGGTVIALHPLLETPFLSYTEASEINLMNDFNLIHNYINHHMSVGNTKPKILYKKKVQESLPMGRFGSAGNLLFDAPSFAETDDKAIMPKLYQMLRSSRYISTEFLPIKPVELRNGDKGSLKEKGILMDPDDFLKEYTDNGLVYHGTKDIKNLLSMKHNGFFPGYDSDGGGITNGLFVTKDKRLASAYMGDRGINVRLQIKNHKKLRILNLNSNSEEVRKFLGLPHHILRQYYNLDIIIIRGGLPIIQNADVLKISKGFMNDVLKSCVGYEK